MERGWRDCTSFLRGLRLDGSWIRVDELWR
jgi:hypothetical protein